MGSPCGTGSVLLVNNFLQAVVGVSRATFRLRSGPGPEIRLMQAPGSKTRATFRSGCRKRLAPWSEFENRSIRNEQRPLLWLRICILASYAVLKHLSELTMPLAPASLLHTTESCHFGSEYN